MSYQSSYEYMPMMPKTPLIPICKMCSDLKIPDVPKLTCGHYICVSCYLEMKGMKRDNCILCDRKMKIRCPRY